MGGALSCPRNHRLKGVEFRDYTNGWGCDNSHCSIKKTTKRYRCISGCDFDFCEACMRSHLSDGHVNRFAKKETTLVLKGPQAPKPQSGIRHQHFLAEVTFRCNVCGENDEGNRQHCPACLHNVCKACCVKKLVEEVTPSGNDQPEKFTFEPKPFGAGTSRLAFKATVYTKSGKILPYVLKTWKPEVMEYDLDMEQCVKIHLEAYRLAQEFRNDVKINHPIIFKKPLMLTMPSSVSVGGRTVAKKGEKVMLEPFIFGDYDKYNSNNGWVDHTSTAPNAFTHYTWHKTEKLIVCDLQGNRQIQATENDGYYFTDPAICSLDESWGITDLGAEGIASFFQEHKCNAICKNWDKPEGLKVPTTTRSKRTTFTSGASACQSRTNESLLALIIMKLMLDAATD